MDLTETLEICLEKVLKVASSANKIINGEEKQLVLEVGGHTTKIVEYIVKSGTIQITAGAVLNTPVNAVQNDRLVNNNTLSNLILQALRQEKIKTKEMVVSIASKEIIIREMNVPNMREKELKSFVQINSNDIFPVKLSNYLLAYHIIEKGTVNRVMIAAIPKDIVTSYIELGKKLGIKVKGINYSGYELYNFIDYELDTVKESYLAVDIGARNTNIIIISNGILKFNKIIPKGLEETSKNISEELECPLTRAEQLKRQYNTIEVIDETEENVEKNVVAKYTKRCIDGIMQDVLRVIEFFNSNNSKNKISKVYLIGTAGKIKGVEEYLSNKLNISVKSLKLFNKVTFTKKSLKLKPRQQSFINCLGAQKLKDRNFYFIKGDLDLKKLSFVLKSSFHKLAICVLLIMGVLITLEVNSLQNIDANLKIYNDYIASKSEVIALQREISSKKAEIDTQNANIKSISSGMEECIGIINIVDETIKTLDTDATVEITRYRFQRSAFEIRGRIDIPLDASQSSEYYKYTNLPFILEETIEGSIKKDVNVSSNTSGISSIEFTLKISID